MMYGTLVGSCLCTLLLTWLDFRGARHLDLFYLLSSQRHPCQPMNQLACFPIRYVMRTRIHTPQLSSNLSNTPQH
jgi:hypothetical protein